MGVLYLESGTFRAIDRPEAPSCTEVSLLAFEGRLEFLSISH
jgi:hypothetical protein